MLQNWQYQSCVTFWFGGISFAILCGYCNCKGYFYVLRRLPNYNLRRFKFGNFCLTVNPMTLRVPDDVLAKTTKCEHDHSCIEMGQSGERPLCKMDRSYGKDLMSVIPNADDEPCAYRVFFGYGHICACPLHGAIAQDIKN